MEAVGLLAPHAVRVASQTRLKRHLSDYVADLQAVGRGGHTSTSWEIVSAASCGNADGVR